MILLKLIVIAITVALSLLVFLILLALTTAIRKMLGLDDGSSSVGCYIVFMIFGGGGLWLLLSFKIGEWLMNCFGLE